MNSENIAAAPAQEHIDAVEVQERLSWPSAPAAAYCDTWLMVNAGALNFKASEEHQVAAMANIGYQLLQEIAAYRPAFQWTNSPSEIVGSLVEEAANQFLAPVQPVALPVGWISKRTIDSLANARDFAKVPYHHSSTICAAQRPNGPVGEACTVPVFAAPAAQGAGATFARQLVDSGAENYIGEVFATERGGIEVTARYVHGKTPADKLAELEASLPAALGDAKDAKRYRELRDGDRAGDLLHFMLMHADTPADTVDTMIDTAIAARKDRA